MEEITVTAQCADCRMPYEDFKLDTVLSDDQWAMINPEGIGIILCANCIAKRAAKVPGVIVLSARFRMSDEYKKLQPEAEHYREYFEGGPKAGAEEGGE